RTGSERPLVRALANDFARFALLPNHSAGDVIGGKLPNQAVAQLPACNRQRFDVGAVDRIDEDLIGPTRKKDFIILVGSEAQISNDSVAVRQTIGGFQSISAHGGGEPISRQI